MPLTRATAPREPRGEPAAAGADVGDARSVGNAQLVHHPIGLLPLLAVGVLQEAEGFRPEETALRRRGSLRPGRRGRCLAADREKAQQNGHARPDSAPHGTIVIRAGAIIGSS